MKKFAAAVLGLILIISLPFGISELLSVFSEEKDTYSSDPDTILSAVVSVYGEDGADEAYKAFAVIVETLMERGEFSPVEEEGYLCCDLSGFSAERLEKIRTLTDSVKGQVLLYENEPILPAFHQSSFGNTLSYAAVFGEEIAYLSVSESDKTMREQVIEKSALEELYGVCDGLSAVSDGNIVTEVIGENLKVSADVFREACGIYSPVFELYEAEDSYTVKSYGIGHQVGLSITGAEEMAAEGASYDEILMHYYKGASIGKSLK